MPSYLSASTASGQPKILDFGVARLTDADVQATTLHTDVGQLVGTLPYMSPEQVAADPLALDTRSDVYALGVILYEMLSGDLPYDLKARSIPDAVRMIQTVEPSRLSSFNTVFRGDVETIVSKALEKDPARRYQSAGELAADLRRYLTDQPIAARPPSTLYQFRKFARRNQAAVIGAAAVFIVLVAGVIATSIGMLRAHRAKALADAHLADAQNARRETLAVNDFLNEILYSADPARHEGREMTVREALDEAAGRIEEFAKDAPAVQAELHQTIGLTYTRLGLDREATPHLQAAYDMRRELFGPKNPLTIESVSDLGKNLLQTEDLDAAESLIKASIAALSKAHLDNTEELSRQYVTLARIHKQHAEYPDAIAALEESIRLSRKRGDTVPGLADALNELGAVLSREGQFVKAEEALREALDIQRKLYGEKSAYAGGVLSTLAVALKRRGKFDEAEKTYREAIEILRATHGDKHPSTITAMVNLGALLADRGSYADAESIFREALPLLRELHGDDSFHVGIASSQLANALRLQGKPQEAESYARDAVDVFTKAVGAEHPYTAKAQGELGSILMEEQAYADAAKYFELASETYGKALGDDHPAYPEMIALLATAQRAQGNPADAETSFQRAEKLLLTQYNNVKADESRADEIRNSLSRRIAKFYTQWGKSEESQTWTERGGEVE